MTTFVLPFEKMHGCGNDFIILERRNMPPHVKDNVLAELLCNRNFSIGADGIIIVDFARLPEADFKWDYYNSDGSTAEMCGNGMRCFAKYVFERGLTDETSFGVLTKAGIIKPTINSDGTVRVDMGKPTLPKKTVDTIEVDDQKINYTYIETGNPHCVIFLDKQVDEHYFYNLGPKIEKLPVFPKGTNVEFANVVRKDKINCRVWERGAGATLACGTGACAVVVAAHLNSFSDSICDVVLPGGILNIQWDRASNSIYLNGPATFVFTGEYPLELSKSLL